MTLGQHEMFHFEKTPMLYAAASADTDATADPQGVAAAATVKVLFPGASENDAFCEPEKFFDDGNPHHVLDNFSRLIAIGGRSAGTGNWAGSLVFRREASATNLLTISLGADFYQIMGRAAPSPPTCINSPFPVDFMKSIGGSEALDDTLTVQFMVTPGQAAADLHVFGVIYIVPGFLADKTNKGVNVSASQFRSWQ